MIHHLKALDLEITDFSYYYDPTYTGENIPSQTSKYVMRDGVEYPTSGASQKKAKLDRAEQ